MACLNTGGTDPATGANLYVDSVTGQEYTDPSCGGAGGVGSGSSLNELGAFGVQLGNIAASIFSATQTPTYAIPKSNLPQSSIGSIASGSSSILLIGFLVVGGIFALKALRK